MYKDLFDLFKTINKSLDNKICEISVKQSRMSFSFDDMGIIKAEDYKKIDNLCRNYSISEVTAFGNMIHIHFSNLSQSLLSNNLIQVKDGCGSLDSFYSLIFELRDRLCTCPALEYVISESYLKIYIDLPNLFVKDIMEVDKLIGLDGILELNNQRPYVLYVKDWNDEEEE